MQEPVLTIGEAHARWDAARDRDWAALRAKGVPESELSYWGLPNKFARSGAERYGRIAWGLAPAACRRIFDALATVAEGKLEIGYANAYTSRASSSGMGRLTVSYRMVSREDFDSVAELHASR